MNSMDQAALPKGIRLTQSGTYEVTVHHTALPNGRIFRNFDDLTSAAEYRGRLLAELDARAVTAVTTKTQLSKMISEYLSATGVRIAPSDRILIEYIGRNAPASLNVEDIDIAWAERWVQTFKSVDKLSPGSIRKRVGSLARALDWWHRYSDPHKPYFNPLKALPRGYAVYGPNDHGKRVDQRRTRRLNPGEEEAIVAAINGWKNPKRERILRMDDRAAFLMLFRLLINTGLRLREAYRIRASDVDMDQRTIHIRNSKTNEPRDVPMTRQLCEWMRDYMANDYRPLCGTRLLISKIVSSEDSPIFPWWYGSDDPKYLALISSRLSERFRTLFNYVGASDLHEHDLRREAISRFMLMKDKSGNWLLRPEEVRKISGHRNTEIFEQYIALRAGELANRLAEAA